MEATTDNPLPPLPPPVIMIPMQATIRLFGNHFTDYVLWQTRITEEEQAQFFDPPLWEYLKATICAQHPGSMPDRRIFVSFMNWLRFTGRLFPRGDLSTTSSLQLTQNCRHPLHPGAFSEDMTENCPVCIMRQCVGSLQRMSDVWESIGGPFIEQATGNDRPIYVQLRQLWRVEKCRWANLVRIYQPRAIQEQIWEREEMEDSGHTEEVIESARSCTKAMEIARSVSETIEDRVPAPPTYPTNFPFSPPPLPPRVLRKKVVFAEGIVENPPRRLGAYNRFSTRYEGGRYACPEEAGWEDTSFKNDEFYPHVYQELGEAESLAIATDAASLLVRTDDEDQTLGDDGDDNDDDDDDEEEEEEEEEEEDEDMSSDYSESSDDSDDSTASIVSLVDAEDVAIMGDIDMNDADDEESSDDSDGTKEFVKWWLSN